MLFNKKPDDNSTGSRRPSAGSPAGGAQATSSRAPVGSSTLSVIDPWLTIIGSLESQGDVRVEGQISGDIRCANLVVGRDATVSGDIIANEAIVRGRVKGTIRANRVILQDTACVESAVYHKVLSVDEGATFDGQSCHRTQPHQEDEATALIVTPGRDTPAITPFERGSNADTGLQVLDA